eukprot:4723139-Prymnesium_polylepis.3
MSICISQQVSNGRATIRNQCQGSRGPAHPFFEPRAAVRSGMSVAGLLSYRLLCARWGMGARGLRAVGGVHGHRLLAADRPGAVDWGAQGQRA